MSVHAQQIASVLRRAIQARLVKGLHDPRVRGMISVTEIRLTDDYSEARVYVSVLPQEHERMTLKGLHSAAGHLRREIAGEVSFRRMPRLIFKLDSSLKKQAEVNAAIRRAVDDDSSHGETSEPTTAEIAEQFREGEST